MWNLYYDVRGRLDGATNGSRSVVVNGSGWREFIEWNAAQPTPLDLSDKAPPPLRKPRPLTVIMDDIRALRDGTAQQMADFRKLQLAALAMVVQENPKFARALNVAIDGDEVAV